MILEILLESDTNRTNWKFPFIWSAVLCLIASEAVLGGGRNWKRRLGKKRVWFGHAELSIRLDGIVVCALSSGHGQRNP